MNTNTQKMKAMEAMKTMETMEAMKTMEAMEAMEAMKTMEAMEAIVKESARELKVDARKQRETGNEQERKKREGQSEPRIINKGIKLKIHSNTYPSMSISMSLIRTTNGKTKTWNAWIEGTTIVVEQDGSKIVVESKNPDKELKTLRQKKIKQGFHEGVPDPCAMLAHEWKKDKLAFPVYVQPKLDGIRCLVYQKEGQWVFQSRNHTVFQSFPHLEKSLPIGMILDGELYRHGLDFQAITSIVRKKDHPDLSQLQYHVYDIVCEGTFEERYKRLIGLKDMNLVLTESRPVHSVDEIERYHEDCVERGYEGIMIRNPKGLYKQARSKDLLKYKHFKTDEFLVVGHTVGKGDIVVFECSTKETKNEKRFGVMMKATLEDKQEMLTNIQEYYGKWLTVKYQELSKDGVPRFPVGIGWRIDGIE